MSRRAKGAVVGEGIVVGALRIDASARVLARRLQPGEIAVIDVLDLDRASAEALVNRSPGAVLNVQSSISGRYPAGGASVLSAAGIPLIDQVDSAILTLRDGTVASIDFLAHERSLRADVTESTGTEANSDSGTGVGNDGALPAQDRSPKSKGSGKRGQSTSSAAAAESGSDAATSTDSAESSAASTSDKDSSGKEGSDKDAAPGEKAGPNTGASVAGDASSATRSNPLSRWWQARAEQRTARKRASLTWLDDLRAIDGSDSADARKDVNSGHSPSPGDPKASNTPQETTAVAPQKDGVLPTGPWRASIDAGGLDLRGTVMDAFAVDAALAQAQAGMATQLAVFTANAMDVVDRTREALLEGDGLPDLGVDVHGKHVVIVAPGYGAAAALRSIRPYLRDHKPVVIGIGDAAEIARKVRCQPAVVIGATSSVSDATLTAARTVITHQPGGEHADASEARLGALQRDHVTSDVPVSSEDLALLLARAGGAKTIVTVGVDATLLDFLESGRVDAAGTFLARLSVGSRLVDAHTLASVYRPRWSGVVIIAGIVLAAIALGAALWANADSRAWIEDVLNAAGVTV